MSIKELYKKACEMGVENMEANVQYRDGGGDYYGYDALGEEYFFVVDGKVYL